MVEPKTCPFCGHFPTTEVRVTQMGSRHDEDHIDFSIVCRETIRLKINESCTFFEIKHAMGDALGAWNRRSEDSNG